MMIFQKKMKTKNKNQSGFSLIEVVTAMLITIVLMLGTLTVFTFAVQYNRGNNLRSQALTVLQQEAETYRSKKFIPSSYADLTAGTYSNQDRTSVDGTVFSVTTTIDNDPVTAGIQTSNESTCTLKEIKITVTPKYGEAEWEKAIAATLTIQRVRGN